MFQILVINVGSTSVKLSIFQDEKSIADADIPLTEKATLDNIDSVYNYVKVFLQNLSITLASIDAIAARGGLLRPLIGGTYLVNDTMLKDLKTSRFGVHASNLSPIIADRLAQKESICTYVVDPVTIDEFQEVARITGIPAIRRKSAFHALSQKAAARRASAELGKKYEEASLIVAHMGGGITVGAHLKGRVVDANNGLDGDGPITPERAGTIPAGDLVRLCFSGKHTQEEIIRMLVGSGGMTAYFGSSDMKLVDEKRKAGDQTAQLMVEAMAYSIAKQIFSTAAVLSGQVDAVVLTGGLIRWQALIDLITPRVSFIAPIIICPENLEMSALAGGVLRVLQGKETALDY